MRLPLDRYAQFIDTIRTFYVKNKREFPWRQSRDPYHILVSEVMLQQTQTYRVLPKYLAFIAQFPDLAALARASQVEVLRAWQGLGYNRRALYLKRCAQALVQDHQGETPTTSQELEALPGIGPHTAASIIAFAYNQPTVFIETNIRSVFIHHFFKNARRAIHDREILPLVQKTLDIKNPREWYYALMDYGVMIKQTHPNPSRKSAHHHLQKPFKGSDRRVRGLVLKALLKEKSASSRQLRSATKESPERIRKIMQGLIHEGFVQKKNRRYALV